jgi:hypothetical protein
MARERVNVIVGQASIPIGRENPKIFTNQSNLVIRKLQDLSDVDLSANVDGAILVYNSTSQKFVATTTLSKQVIDGGTY